MGKKIGQENTIHKENEFESIKQEQFNKLYKALDCIKGHEVMADTLNGFMTYQVYEDFDYSLSKNVKKDLLLNLKDVDNRAEQISFKLDEVMDIYVDDNEECLDGITNEPYEVQNIIITLWNDSQLRLEFQW